MRRIEAFVATAATLFALAVSSPARAQDEAGRRVSGRLVAARRAVITAPEGSKIAEVLVEIGAAVQAGDRIAVLDDADPRLALEVARVDLARAELALESARIVEKRSALETDARRRDVERARERLAHLGELSRSGMTSPRDLEAAQSDVESGEAGLALADAALDLAKVGAEEGTHAVERARLETQRAELRVEAMRLTAPFAGRVDSLDATPGAWVGPGTPLAEIVAADEIAFEADLAEVLVPRFAAGAEVAVHVPSLGDDVELAGRVQAITPAPGQPDRLPAFRLRVRVDLSDAQELAGRLLPGLGAHVVVPGR